MSSAGGNEIALKGPWHSPCRARASQKGILVFFGRGHNCLSHGPHANPVASVWVSLNNSQLKLNTHKTTDLDSRSGSKIDVAGLGC